MQVLKFGGTSVGSSKNINKVITILEEYSKKDKVICVVSAIGGITDKLLKAGHLAKDNDKNYKLEYKSIKAKHLKVLEELIPNNNTAIVAVIEGKLKNLKNLLDGIFLINELSPQTSDRLVSYGELLSSLIIAETLKNNGVIMLCGSIAMQNDVLAILNTITTQNLQLPLSTFKENNQIKTDCY